MPTATATAAESLSALRRVADTLDRAFEATLAPLFSDRWDFYKALDRGESAPESQAAHDAWIDALHRFYLARDGEHGVLGGRGL